MMIQSWKKNIHKLHCNKILKNVYMRSKNSSYVAKFSWKRFIFCNATLEKAMSNTSKKVICHPSLLKKIVYDTQCYTFLKKCTCYFIYSWSIRICYTILKKVNIYAHSLKFLYVIWYSLKYAVYRINYSCKRLRVL